MNHVLRGPLRHSCAFAILITSAPLVLSAPVEIEIDCSTPTVPLSPHLYGLFFEDINYAADGGIYAELVQNRSFEYHPVKGRGRERDKFHPLYAWEKVERGGATCALGADQTSPLNSNNTHYMVLEIPASGGAAGVANRLSPYGDERHSERALAHAHVIGTHPESFPDTHGSPLMGMGYAALGALADPRSFRSLMDANRWWFILAQCPDGSF